MPQISPARPRRLEVAIEPQVVPIAALPEMAHQRKDASPVVENVPDGLDVGYPRIEKHRRNGLGQAMKKWSPGILRIQDHQASDQASGNEAPTEYERIFLDRHRDYGEAPGVERRLKSFEGFSIPRKDQPIPP